MEYMERLPAVRSCAIAHYSRWIFFRVVMIPHPSYIGWFPPLFSALRLEDQEQPPA